MSLLKAMVFKLWAWMNTHKDEYLAHVANASAHHAAYTDTQAINAIASNKYRCKMTRSINYAVPDATGTMIPFENETIDVGNMVDIASNPTRITIKKTGMYLLYGNLYWKKSASSGYVNSAIWTNGGFPKHDMTVVYHGANEDAVEKLLGFTPLNINDYIEIRARHDSFPSASRELNYNWTHFEAFLIA